MGFDVAREERIATFLAEQGWGGARLDWLPVDASTRRYGRLSLGDGRAGLLMDAPPVEDPPCRDGMDEAARRQSGWNALSRLAGSRIEAYAAVAAHLHDCGLSAPEVIAGDPQAGLAIIEDFGRVREFARLIEQGEDEIALYTEAAKALAHLHRAPPPQRLQALGHDWPILALDAVALRANADLFVDWLPAYDPRFVARDGLCEDWAKARETLIEAALSFPRDFTLRDYHAENLLWLPDRSGIARVGLLDFQDAVIGWDAWDMAMLVQDARRTVSPEARETAIATYLSETGKDEAAFRERLAVIGTLNALRITGIFARLMKRDGKMRYKAFMARQQQLLARNLEHPSAGAMADFVRRDAPFIFEAAA